MPDVKKTRLPNGKEIKVGEQTTLRDWGVGTSFLRRATTGKIVRIVDGLKITKVTIEDENGSREQYEYDW